jgi:anti-sigma factor RsiW
MNCHEAGTWLGAYADNEVGGLRRYRIKRHLHGCAACSTKHQGLLTLRAQVRSEVPCFKAPPQFRARLRAQLADVGAATATPARPQPDRWLWLSGGALAGCAATVLAWVATTATLDWRTHQNIAIEAVALHTRAVLSDQLIQVASSDQHTVKPWLSARLDYSPPVLDLANDGFALIGGRLDTLHEKQVATLVYRYRRHMIDVFVQPESERAQPEPRTVRGFNVVTARGSGMDWLAVSDVNSEELTAFVHRLAVNN